MKKLLLYLGTFVLCLILTSYSFANGFINDADGIEKAAKSVLKIYVYENIYAEEPFATGSGFVAFDNSTLITNYHVIDGAAAVFASDDDDNVYQLDKVLCADKKADIAILGFSAETNLEALELYPDDQLKRGSPVVAIGSPKGLKNTVSTGIVSYQYVEDGIPEIQITAPISPGSSGGALLNDDGKVIGVTSAIYKSTDEFGEKTDAQNLNFAVNIAVAQAMYNAWDGTKTTISSHKTTAEMDYTGVYNHGSELLATTPSKSEATTEAWVCLNCGKENTTKFCLECGAERPFWICSCGNINSSNKFCGECGKSYISMINAFNNAIQIAAQNEFEEAAGMLKELGQFNSGSFETVEGTHTEAKNHMYRLYYMQGMHLMANNGSHEEIIEAFTNAGDYEDAKEKIDEENIRYLKSFYDTGMEYLNNGDYDAAIKAFLNAGDYPEAANQVLASYYMQGIHLLETGEYDKAREAFEKAGEYKDSKNMISEAYYLEADEALDSGDYELASTLFSQVDGYQDASDRAITAKVLQIRQKLDEINTNPDTMTEVERVDLENLLVKVSKYESNAEALSIYKEINYNIAKYKQNKDLETAVKYYMQAEDYLDAEEQLLDCQMQIMESLLAQGKKEQAMKYYTEIDPDRKKQDYVIIQPGSVGKHVEILLSLLKQIGIETKGKLDLSNYNDEYIPYVKRIEEFIGTTADGFITVNEFEQLDSIIFPNCESDNVTKLLEKLADLSYISKLPQTHSKYDNKYINAIKKAESALNLFSDGIITQNEYSVIMDQMVEKPQMIPKLNLTLKNDIVTLTWSKVPEAVYYEIIVTDITGKTTEYKTDKTNWADKDIITGTSYIYSITANKYTVSSDATSERVEVPIYYKRVTISELNKNLEKYVGRHVEISNTKFDRYKLINEKGSSDIFTFHMPAKNKKYELDILCKDSSGLVEFRFEDISTWDWDGTDIVALCYSGKLQTFSGKGYVASDTADWHKETKNRDGLLTYFYYKNAYKVPVIFLENASWSFRNS